jgi:hypothetical protein
VKAQPNFDPIARPYQWLEYLTLGRLLERTRLHFLPQLLTARCVLVLGDGDGRFLSHLLAANPILTATAVDGSAEMLRLLRQRCAPHADRLIVHHGDALVFSPPEGVQYDLVVTHFFLDCLTQPEVNALIARLVPSLSPSALWVVSDFRIPAGRMHLPAQILVRSLYLAFRVLTGLRTSRLPNHGAAFYATGFLCLERKLLAAGVLTTELWQRGNPAATPR